MPSDSSDYTAAEGYTDKAQRNNLAAAPFHDFEQLNTAQSAEVSRAFGLIESYTNLMFAPISETPTSHAAIRLADSSSPPTSFSEDPQKDLPVSGDVFYGAAARDPTIGSLSSAPILHEIGHALGLNHGDPGNSNGPFGPIGAQYDDIEYSVMNYAAFIGAPITDPLGADAAAQSYMMYDIAALQYYYGANFGNVGKNFTYSWNRSTGQEFINGQGQGEPLIDTVFETVWTGGATSTYDLSNYNDDAWLDMRPGQFMKFSNGQLNELGLKDDAVPEYAQGNVYNALLFNGDTRSEINNVITGNGSDIVIGNDVFNIITLGNGNDSVLIGGAGARVFGGTGNDTIVPSAAPSEIHGGGGWNKLDYSWEKDPITINVQNGAAVKPDWPFEPVIDEFTNIQSFFGGAGNDTFISGKGHFDFDGGGGSNKLDYSWDSAGITVDLSIGQVDKGNQGSGTIILARWQGTDEVKNIQSFVGGSGNNTFISAAGSFMFDGSTGKSTLDYSWDQADLRVELSHDPLAPQGGTVDKGWVTTVPIWTPGGGGGFVLHTWQGSDTFDNVQSFVGGSGKNTFISAAGSFNFNGGTGTSTLDYSWDQGTVTVDLLHGTVDKGVAGGSWQGADRFTNIQNFIGGSGGIKFLINHYGSFSFNGSTSGSSTFDYSGDTSSQFGLVVDARAGTAVKTVPTVGSVGSYLTSSTDTFSNIQQFVGGAGHNTFMDTTGLYTFDGGGGVTTLDESWDQADLSINLELGTIDKGWVAATSGFFPINWQGQDTIINVQNFIGGAGNDSIVDARTISGLPAATGSHSFNGGGGINTAYFHGAHTEYTIATALGSDGQLHTTVVDNGSAGDGPIDLVNVQHLQFTDGLYDRALTGGLSDRAPVVIVDGWTPSLGRSFAASSLFTAVDPDGDPITNYAFWNSGVGGGHFVLNGSAEPVNKEVDITAAQLAQLSYQSGSGGDTLWVKASDGSKWSAWSPGFTVDAPIDPGPVITAANTMLSKGQTTITASSLFTATDPLSLPITKYAFWDSGTAGGRFVLNGVAQGTNQEISYRS
jgi:serralysin